MGTTSSYIVATPSQNVALDLDSQAEALFRNRTVINQILRNVPANQISRFRTVNKAWNGVTSEHLYRRQNLAKTFDSDGSLTRFLDTMARRLDTTPCYASVTVDLPTISVTTLERFSTQFNQWLRILNLRLSYKCNACYYTGGQFLRFMSATEDWNHSKAKAVQILSRCPNIVRLSLEFDEDLTENRMSDSDRRSLPQTFPNLKSLEFHHLKRSYCHAFRPPRSTRFSPVTILWRQILNRAPNLDRILISRDDSHCSPSLEQLPQTLAESPSCPVLVLKRKLILYLDGTGHNQSHLKFLQNCNHWNFGNCRVVDISMKTPSNGVLTVVNAFLALQATTMEQLKLEASANLLSVAEYNLIVPPMPNLILLEINLRNWNPQNIRPITVTRAEFPKLTAIDMQVVNRRPVSAGRVDVTVVASA